MLLRSALAALALFTGAPAAAAEIFAGIAAHGVDTPFTFETGEGGADVSLGYRFDRIDALTFLGRPAPYLLGVANLSGDTNFIAAGLSWKLGAEIYVRPGIGLAVHDGPERRFADDGRETDLGSRILFEPEIAAGVMLSERFAVEASWVHVSHARIFNSGQNPGLDIIGARLVFTLD